MKADKETELFRVVVGSRLYGTATATSDFDYKAVTLPKLDDLLLNRKVTNRKEKPVGMSATDKMKAGETETEYLPLQVFFDDFYNGQTYALEVAFAVAQHKHETTSGFAEQWVWMMEVMLERFLTKSVKKMVGYAVSQSKLYGLKTERYTSLRVLLETVDKFVATHVDADHASMFMKTMKLKDAASLVAELLKLPHVKMTMVANARGGLEDAPALEVAGKKFPMTNYLDTMYDSLLGTLENYGTRVKEFDGEGVDWKALSHALRITEQVLELCTTGKLVFPRPNAEFLRAVKNGEKTLDEATEALATAFAKVDDAINTSVLRERTPELDAEFETWKLVHLKKLYELNGPEVTKE